MLLLRLEKSRNGLEDGAVAQSVEQRTENPCVGGSIPSRTTLEIKALTEVEAFLIYLSLLTYLHFTGINWRFLSNDSGIIARIFFEWPQLKPLLQSLYEPQYLPL